MIKAYLYDARGEDCEIEIGSGALPELRKDQLLWLDVVGRDPSDLGRLADLLSLKPETVGEIGKPSGALTLNNHGDYFHCSVAALNPVEKPASTPPSSPKAIRLDFLVGKEWVATVEDEALGFLDEFRERDRAETVIGVLTAPSLAASLLDAHLTSYHAALEALESFLDALDLRLLAGRRVADDLLTQVVAARRYVARIRRTLGAQRTVFYGLARPDFAQVASSDASEPYRDLARRFERVLDSTEHARELVQGSFDLFSTRIAEATNVLLRRLTFLSLMLGGIGAVAGIFGMNFKTRLTESGEVGFWVVVGALLALIAGATAFSRSRKWI